MVRLCLCRLAPVAALLLLLWLAHANAGALRAQETYFFLLFPQLTLDEPSPGQPSPGEATPGQPSPGEATPGEPSPGQPSPGQPSPGEPSPGEAVAL